MSTTVDERVVSLKFDNSEFEQNVQVSLTTLDKLKQSLNFGNETKKSFENIEAASNNVKLSGIQNAINQVKMSFSSLDVIGATIIGNLTNTVVNRAKNAISSAIGTVVHGGITRAMNLEQAQFQLRGIFKETAENAPKTAKVMEHVSAAVDGTAYSLDQAAVVASQLSATFTEADATGEKMGMSLRAVAGVAAMTGREYSDIGRIFTTVAGNGRLMGDQLLQLSSSGINAAAAIGDFVGKTEAEVRDMVSHGEVSFEMFANAMDYAFGEHAQKANETFSGAMSNMKSALARIGAEVATPALPRFRDVLLALKDAFDAIHYAMMPWIDRLNDFIAMLSTKAIGVITKITEKINKLYERVDNGDGTKRVEVLSKNFQNLLKIFDGFCAAIDIVRLTLGALFDVLMVPIKPVLKSFGLLNNTLLQTGAGLADVIIAFRDKYAVIIEKFHGKIDGLNSSIVKHIGKLKDWMATNSKFGEAYKGLVEFMKSAKKVIVDFFKNVKSVDDIKKNYSGLSGIVDSTTVAFKALGSAILSLKRPFEVFVTAIKNGQRPIDALKTTIDYLIDSFQSKVLFGPFADAFSQFGKVFEEAQMLFEKLFGTIDSDTGDAENTLVSFSKNVSSNLKDATTNIVAFEESIKNFAKYVRSNLRENVGIGEILAIALGVGMIYALRKLPGLINQLNPVANALNSFSGAVSNLGATFKAAKRQINANAVLTISIAIAILAGSLALLASIEPKKLWSAVGALTAVTAALAGLVALATFGGTKFEKIIPTIKNALVGTKLLVEFVGGIFLIILALKLLSTVNTENMGAQMTALLVLMGAMVGVAFALNKFNKVIGNLAVIETFSKAMVMLTGALLILSLVPVEGLFERVGALLVIMGGMLAVVKLLNKMKAVNIKGMTGLIAFAGALLLFTLSLKLLSQLNFKKLEENFGDLVLIIMLMAGVLAATRAAGANALGAAAALGAMGLAIFSFALAIKVLAKMSKSDFKKGYSAVAQISLIFALLIEATHFAGQHAHKAAATIAAMAGTFVLLTACIVVLSKIKPNGLTRAVTAISVIGLVFGGIIALTKFSKLTASAYKSIIALGVILGLVSASLGVLSMIEPKKLEGSVSALIKTMVAVGVLMKIITSIQVSPGAIQSMAALATILTVTSGCLFLLGQIPAERAMASAAALTIVLGDLLGAMAIMGKLTTVVTPQMLGSLGVSLAVLGILSLLLFGLSKLDVTNAIPAVKQLTVLVQLMAIMSLTCTVLGLAAAPAMAGLGVFTALVVALGAMLIGLGKLNEKFPKLKEFVEKGIPLLNAIGSGLGSFFGGIIEGFIGSASKSLTQFGTALGQFGENSAPFFSAVKDVDKNAAQGAKYMAQAVMELSKANFADAFSSFVGGRDLGAFSSQVGQLAEGITAFNGKIKNAKIGDEDILKIKSIANAVNAIAQIDVARTGGLAQGLMGTKSLIPLIEAMAGTDGNAGLGESFAKLQKALPEKISTGKIQNMAEALNAIAEINIPTSGLSIKSLFVGEVDFGDFGDKMSKLAAALGKASVAGVLIVPGIINNIVTAAKNLSKIDGKGLVSVGKSLKNFDGTKFVEVAKAINKFTLNLKVNDTQLNSANTAAKITKSLVISCQEAAKLGNGGSITTFVNALPKLASALSDFSKDAGSIDTSGLDSANKALNKSLKSIRKTIKNTDLSGASKNLTKSFKQGVTGSSLDISSSFTTAVNKAVTAINKKKNSFYSAGSSLAKKVKSGIGSVSLYKSGQSLAQGAINGAKSSAKMAAAYNAGVALANKFNAGFKSRKGADINSPSRVFMKNGASLVEGAVKGVNNNLKSAYNSGASIAKSSSNGFNDSIHLIAASIEGAMSGDYAPVIAPVLDLTEIQNGSAAIDSMFANTPLAVDMTGANAIMNSFGNSREDPNATIVSAIDGLRRDMKNYDRTVNNINGVTYDDGSNIIGAVEQIVHAAKVGGRV